MSDPRPKKHARSESDTIIEPTCAKEDDEIEALCAWWKAQKFDEDEPMLIPNSRRFVLGLDRDPQIWKAYQTQLNTFWTPKEVSLIADRPHFEKLTPDEQRFIKHVLGFFAGSDGGVAENLAQRFMRDVQWPEIRCFYGFQLAMENIHAEMYTKLIDFYIQDTLEKQHLMYAIENIPSVKKKQEWVLHWLSSERTFAERLVAFACVEGILFSASFCAIFWFKKSGLLPGLCNSNEWINRDENLHCDFACLLYSKLKHKLPIKIVQAIVTSALENEIGFIADALPKALRGMNASMMTTYCEFVADRMLQKLQAPKVYNSENPFPWMDLICMKIKTNFFEDEVTDYSHEGKTLRTEPLSFEEDY